MKKKRFSVEQIVSVLKQAELRINFRHRPSGFEHQCWPLCVGNRGISGLLPTVRYQCWPLLEALAKVCGNDAWRCLPPFGRRPGLWMWATRLTGPPRSVVIGLLKTG